MENYNELKDILLKSCNKMYDCALTKCSTDYVDEKHGCSWYHSAWQYLRLLNCVSSPQWHEDFYIESIASCLKNLKSAQILISGTADYSMLHIIVATALALSIKTHITILDKCETPLDICKWYTENYKGYLDPSLKYNHNLLTFEFIQKDILLLDESKKYDIICADAFLTRFDRYSAKSIITNWKNHLRCNGEIITTVRLHENSEKKSLLEATEDILSFNQKVQNRYQEFINSCGGFPISEDHLLFLANRYIIKMHSNAIGSQEDILNLFIECNLNVENGKVVDVEGEIKQTQYLQIMASQF